MIRVLSLYSNFPEKNMIIRSVTDSEQNNFMFASTETVLYLLGNKINKYYLFKVVDINIRFVILACTDCIV